MSLINSSAEIPNLRARALRRWATRRNLTAAGMMLIVIGLAANWNWLTALGVAPFLLAVAPCAAMCALGLCISGRSDGATSQEPYATTPDEADALDADR